MENTFKDESVKKLIHYLKQQIKNYVITVRQLDPETKCDFEGQITLIHIIHNRLRRGLKRPHLSVLEKENQYLENQKYTLEWIIEKLKTAGFEGVTYENVCNAK